MPAPPAPTVGFASRAAALDRRGPGGRASDAKAEAKSPSVQRRKVNSQLGFKETAMNKLPVVRVSDLANGTAYTDARFKPPPPTSPPKPPQARSHPPPRAASKHEPSRPLDEPAAETALSEWTQHWDEEVGSTYYFNSITGEATWVDPSA